MQPIYFVHIPKTAGTSFRKACEAFFGLRHVAYDYADDSDETSSFVTDIIYGNGDRLDFFAHIQNNETKFFSGHVHADKYLHLFGVNNTVVFLRDPIQRVYSEYQHFVRHNDYQGDFRSFYTQPRYIDRQSRLLQGAPIEALGFIGLTEDYANSLEQLNDNYNIDIRPVELNRGRSKKKVSYDFSDGVVKELMELNKTDFILYNSAKELFETRLSLFKKGLPYVHGAVQDANKQMIRGWAWFAKDRKPVDIDVWINGNQDGQVLAKDMRPGLLRLAPPRLGYIGFHHAFSKPLATGDYVECSVSETGQVIGHYTA
ncbi:sulfotransferase family 2 domain-containing protein [Vreelandella sp. EE27]